MPLVLARDTGVAPVNARGKELEPLDSTLTPKTRRQLARAMFTSIPWAHRLGVQFHGGSAWSGSTMQHPVQQQADNDEAEGGQA